ncbi:Aste57867_11798 [Aphanomyces stellatus]|uniref:Aste57867_11798 protein n=1 Tax=Aphanomyces stellatus TaxID=120398 RepID=A0A485KTY6_9STRA|nr:hypothetical protein As57867_011753 [Aphanomyces stellatus]VFT88653.1 Aste57867_11798 [Aphanomyces stellatus]
MLRPVVCRITFTNIGVHGKRLAALVVKHGNDTNFRVHVEAEADGPNDLLLVVFGEVKARDAAVEWIITDDFCCQRNKLAGQAAPTDRTYRLQRRESKAISKTHLMAWRTQFRARVKSIDLNGAQSNRKELNPYLKVTAISIDSFAAFEAQFEKDMKRPPTQFVNSARHCGCVMCLTCLESRIAKAPQLPVKCVIAETCKGIVFPAADVARHVNMAQLEWIC